MKESTPDYGAAGMSAAPNELQRLCAKRLGIPVTELRARLYEVHRKYAKEST